MSKSKILDMTADELKKLDNSSGVFVRLTTELVGYKKVLTAVDVNGANQPVTLEDLNESIPDMLKLREGDFHAIVTLTIPEGAIVFVEGGFVPVKDRYDFKLRASNAFVAGWRRVSRMKGATNNSYHTNSNDYGISLVSMYDRTFVYSVDDEVTPTKAFSKSINRCSSGIHFFLNVQGALDYI